MEIIKMTAFHIKLIAIISMAIDHVGLFFFPENELFFMIGRISFPLFAWLIANGVYHTRNIKSYIWRLLIFACLSQIPYYIANQQRDPAFFGLNVLFTLCLGLLAIAGLRHIRKALSLPMVIICAALASVLAADYGAIGVISIVLFYVFFKNKIYLVVSIVLFWILSYFTLSVYPIHYIDPLGLFALIFIIAYNNKEGPKIKYLFYIFYPLQYVFVYLAKLVY